MWSFPCTLGKDSLAACMNLSVRRNKTRRGPGGAGITFGLPMRVKMPLPAVREPGDELDGITELECTVDESRQSCEPAVASSSQENHLAGSSVRTASSSSETECEIDQRPHTLEPIKEACGHSLERSTGNATVESQSVFTSKATEGQVCYQQQNSGAQERTQSFATNPHSATLNNLSRQQADTAASSQQQTLYKIPTPQVVTPSSNSINGSCTIQQQHSSSITPVVSGYSSFSQQNAPPVSDGSQLPTIPAQFHGVGHALGYHADMQFVRPAVAVARAPQDTIVVKGKSYQKLGTIGKGGSSKVSSQKRYLCFAITCQVLKTLCRLEYTYRYMSMHQWMWLSFPHKVAVAAFVNYNSILLCTAMVQRKTRL